MKQFSILLSCFCILIANPLLYPNAGHAQEGMPPIVMVADTNRAEYWLGEPMVLRIRLFNWSSPMLSVMGSFGLQQLTDLRIVHNGIVGERYRAHFEEIPASTKNIKLPYGKAYEFRIIVVYDGKQESRLAFPVPGFYSIQVNQYLEYLNTYDLTRGRTPYPVSLETAPFQVVSPPEAGKKALALLQSNPNAIRDLNRLMASPGTAATLADLAAEHPKTRYAPFCLHALGSLALNQIAYRPSAATTAEKHFRALIAKYPDYPLIDEARLQLARTLSLSARANEARDITDQLLFETEDNFYRFRDSEVMQIYRGPAESPYADINQKHWDLFQTTILPDAYEQIKVEQLR